MDPFHSPCCLCEDLIEVEVGGTMSATIPQTAIAFDTTIVGFQLPTASFSFNRTLSQLFNGISVTVNNLVLRPLVQRSATGAGTAAQQAAQAISALSNKVRLDIADSSGNVLARSVLHIIALSPTEIPDNGAIELERLFNITSVTGYFNGHITLTGNGLLRLLPSSLTINTSCKDINTAFSSLYTALIDILKKYGNSTINHVVCDLVITIPSLLITISDLINNACSSKCKNRVSYKVIVVINKLKNAINTVEVPSSTSSGFNFNLDFIYEINRSLAVLNKILQCDLAEFLCKELSSSSECNESSSDDSNSSNSSNKDTSESHTKHDTKHDTKRDTDHYHQIIQKLSNLETAINRINQANNDTRREFTKLQEKVSQQDKVVKKVAECVFKK